MRKPTPNVFMMIALILLFSVVLSACGGGDQEPSTSTEGETIEEVVLDGESLLQDRCTECHDLKRVESAVKTADEWKTNVERMVSKGATLSSEEQEILVDYLTETYTD